MTSTDVKRPVYESGQKTVINDRWPVNGEQQTTITLAPVPGQKTDRLQIILPDSACPTTMTAPFQGLDGITGRNW